MGYVIRATAVDHNGVRCMQDNAAYLGDAHGHVYANAVDANRECARLQDSVAEYGLDLSTVYSVEEADWDDEVYTTREEG